MTVENEAVSSNEESISKVHQIERKYASFSTASLVLGCLALGLFSWLAIIYEFWSPWIGGMTGTLVFLLGVLLSNTLGVIFGAVSLKKGIKKRSILGLVFSLIGLILHIILLTNFSILYYYWLHYPN